jgi:predicted dehydrogenase
LPTRIGFIGTGGIAGMHMNNLRQIEGVELAAFYDVVQEKAQQRAQQFGGTAFDHHRKMIDEGNLDAVYVCVPPHAHGAELDVAKAGLPLLVEKPVSVNLKQAEKIAEAIESAGILNSVGYHFRYFDLTEKTKQMLKGKTIGMVLGYWMGGMPMVPWWRRMDESGGQLVEQCTHIVDLARYLVGEITKVYCAAALRTMTDVENNNVPDVTTLTMEFENGVVGTMNTSCMMPQGGAVALHIVTRGQTFELTGGSLRVVEGRHTEEYRSAVNGHMETDRAFVKAVKTKKPSHVKSSYADAVKTLAVTLAANKSAQTGKAVVVG